MGNDLIAKIKSHPSYSENLHSALIEVIEKDGVMPLDEGLQT
jgi:hypothetical protein